MTASPMPSDWPRGMRAHVAAAYVGVSVTILRRELPKPVRISAGRVVWLKDDLDAHLDRLAGKITPSKQAGEWSD